MVNTSESGNYSGADINTLEKAGLVEIDMNTWQTDTLHWRWIVKTAKQAPVDEEAEEQLAKRGL